MIDLADVLSLNEEMPMQWARIPPLIAATPRLQARRYRRAMTARQTVGTRGTCDLVPVLLGSLELD